jgi:hypothetical protein
MMVFFSGLLFTFKPFLNSNEITLFAPLPVNFDLPVFFLRVIIVSDM